MKVRPSRKKGAPESGVAAAPPRSEAAIGLARLGLALGIVFCSGCALGPRSRQPVPAPPEVILAPSETEPVEPRAVLPPAPPDSAVARQPKPTRGGPPRVRPAHATEIDSARVDSVALPTGLEMAADSLAPVTVDLPDSERDHLLFATREDLDETLRMLQGVDASKLSADQAAALDSVKGLVEAASVARQRGEIRTAAALAHKARLLAAVLRER